MRVLFNLLALIAVLGALLALPFSRAETDLASGQAAPTVTDVRFFWDSPPADSEDPGEVVRTVSDLRRQVDSLSTEMATLRRDGLRPADTLLTAMAAQQPSGMTDTEAQSEAADSAMGAPTSPEGPLYTTYTFHWPRYALHAVGGLLAAFAFVSMGIVAGARQSRR